MECFSETKTKTKMKFVQLYISYMELKKKNEKYYDKHIILC